MKLKILIIGFVLCVFAGCQDTNKTLIQDDLDRNEYFVSEEFVVNNVADIYAECNIGRERPAIETYGNSTEKSTTKKVKEMRSVKDERHNLPAFYIVNFEEGGFIIVSADTRAGTVLAVSDSLENTFPFDEEIPLGLQFWMDGQKEKISEIRDSGEVPEEIRTYAISEPPLTITSYGPLVQTQWGQQNGFNALMPICPQSGQPYAAGCVNIAVAQIMRYWEHPASYAWNSMNNYSATPATAALIKDLYDLNYSFPGVQQCGTSVYTANMMNTLTGLGYSISKTNDNSGLNPTLVRQQISSGRPIMLYASVVSNSSLAHLWICDGYFYLSPHVGYVNPADGDMIIPSTDKPGYYFHHNWGWQGSYDGWYIEGNFSPSYNFSASSIHIYYDIRALNLLNPPIQ